MNLFQTAVVMQLFATLVPTDALAWGHEGHETVGNIAAALIKGNAKKQVAKLLQPGETLATAAEWPDCAKGFSYCHVDPTAEMNEYSSQNPHHHAYHYADVPFDLPAYQEGVVGSNGDDVVHILGDAILVLQGKAPANDAHVLSKRAALFIVAHMTGDIHQPLHVGAAYLSPDHEFIVPRDEVEAKAGFTQGGNLLCHGSRNMHSHWDDDLVVKAMRTAKVTTSVGLAKALLGKAKAFKGETGAVNSWPTQWATESLALSAVELKLLTVTGIRKAGAGRSPCQSSDPNSASSVWDVQLPDQYDKEGTVTAADQLAKAGARLAKVLQAIWP